MDLGARQAWDKVAEEEANALVAMLESPARKVLVIVIAAEGERAEMLHAVSGGTTGLHLRIFIAAVERKLRWLAGKLKRSR